MKRAILAAGALVALATQANAFGYESLPPMADILDTQAAIERVQTTCATQDGITPTCREALKRASAMCSTYVMNNSRHHFELAHCSQLGGLEVFEAMFKFMPRLIAAKEANDEAAYNAVLDEFSAYSELIDEKNRKLCAIMRTDPTASQMDRQACDIALEGRE